MSNPSEAPRVRPLSGLARWVLTGTTAATIALFYVFICVALLAGLAWLGVVLVIFVACVRFGLGGLVAKYLEREFRLLLLLARSLWLSEGATYRLPLARPDAPRLFAMLDRLAGRMNIPPPNELCLELSCGAWVELRGVKTGLGTTRVGVGYDLLAGLTEQEVEAVMAHELAHAKLIGRFFNNRLAHGLNRSVAVTSRLVDFVDAHRRANEAAGSAVLILAIADRLTSLCARQMSAYSRQGEFEADQGATELCGSAPLRSALSKLPALHRKLARLPWNERVAKIESPEGLSRWLLGELSSVAVPNATPEDEPFDRYSTHPPLADRLAALPDDGTTLKDSPPGLGLCADPDAIALKLVGAIEETAARQEAKDLGDLRKWLRSFRRNAEIRPAQLPGVLIVIIGIVLGLGSFASDGGATSLIFWLVIIPLGVGLYRLGRYRDRRPLPVPPFATFMVARQNYPIPNIEEKQAGIEKELRELVATESNKKRKAEKLIEAAYAELGRIDYLRAHVAARLVVEFRKESVPRDLAMMVASAAFDQGDTANQLLISSLKKTGLRTPATSFAAAWTLLLMGAWTEAEALLHELAGRQPGSTDLQALLALCMARRGKSRTATKLIRSVCEPRAPSPQHLKLLVELLLAAGALREAGTRLAEFGPAHAYDPDVVYFRIQYHLLRREFELADKQLTMIEESQLTGNRLVAIGYLYENARADEQAVLFFNRATAKGHYPEALLALAQRALEAENHNLARLHLQKAFDTSIPLGEKAASIYDQIPRSLALLYALERVAANCRAWITHVLPGKDLTPAAKRTWIVFAPDEVTAATYLQTFLQMLTPQEPPLAMAYIKVIAAPHDLHPVRPVHPGVQYAYR